MKWISIRDKFRIYVLFLLVLPILIFSYIVISSEYNKVIDLNEREQITYLRSVKSNVINSKIDNLEHLIELYASDERLTHNNIDEYIDISREWDVVCKSMDLDIHIHFIDLNHRVLSNNKEPGIAVVDFHWDQNRRALDQNMLWFEPHITLEDQYLILAVSKQVVDNSGKLVGTIGVEIKVTELFYSIKNRDSSLYNKIVLFLNTGKIINLNRRENEPIDYGNIDLGTLNAQSFTRHIIADRDYMVSSIFIERLDIYLASLVLERELRSYINKTLILIISLVLLCILFMLIGGILISRTIILNIKKINSYMKRVSEGDMQIETCVKTNDEFLVLNNYLNSMVDELAQSISRKDELLSLRTNLINIFSHNASTPITILFNNGMLLLQKYPDEKMINDMFFASKDLKGLIDHIMLYLRIDKKNLQLTGETVYVEEITSIILRMYRHSLEKKNIAINKDIEEDLCIEGSYFFVKTIIENLIDNAIKFTKKSSLISIRAFYSGDYLEWIISDSGPGFTEEDREQIFGEFSKLSARPTGNESSTGLGLYIVKKVMDSLGGEIKLGNSEFSGATFHLLFPRKWSEN